MVLRLPPSKCYSQNFIKSSRQGKVTTHDCEDNRKRTTHNLNSNDWTGLGLFWSASGCAGLLADQIRRAALEKEKQDLYLGIMPNQYIVVSRLVNTANGEGKTRMIKITI